ncbi:MAG: 4-(cytidine 5'-diphospho)-2-C-methyl-D-erythritol kinase, partial [Ignavibacteria bacterium]|nr:4-(cytidine 5'-diphospho)-2-C-methyl-D-erythritol kinase [Ignavibacteria bacterium]
MIKAKSYAKINIGLNIISKRDDGYHNIESIFYPINLFDELIFEESNKFEIISDNSVFPTDKSNLIWKVKDLIEDIFNVRINYKVYVKKNIPIFAGLGGGSSNAGTTLLILNDILNLNLNRDSLMQLALQIGS